MLTVRNAARVVASSAWLLSLGSLACTPQAPKPPESPAVRGATLPAGPFVEILGVAQDAGVPQAACTSANCEAARTDPTRVAFATSFVVVGTQGETYLFEASPDLRPQLDRALELGRARGRPEQGRQLLDGIFVTHAHMGHYGGLLHLGFEAAHSQGVPLFGSPRMLSFLGDNEPWRQLHTLNNVVPKSVAPGESVTLADGLRVSAFAVPHRDELSDTLAWKIQGPRQTLLFIPDCDPWSRWAARGFELEPMLEGVDTLLVDATFYSGDELSGRDLEKIGHPMVTDTITRFSPQVQAEELKVVLIHFNHSNPLLDPNANERALVRAAGFEIAKRGMQIEL